MSFHFIITIILFEWINKCSAAACSVIQNCDYYRFVINISTFDWMRARAQSWMKMQIYRCFYNEKQRKRGRANTSQLYCTRCISQWMHANPWLMPFPFSLHDSVFAADLIRCLQVSISYFMVSNGVQSLFMICVRNRMQRDTGKCAIWIVTLDLIYFAAINNDWIEHFF